MSKSVEAWHFIKPDKRMRFGENPELIEVGRTYRVDENKLELCKYGLHASVEPLDALCFVYWNDAVICRVRLSGKILEGADKLCASERTVLWMADADKTLHEFACWCAEQVLYLFEKEFPNDQRPRKAIEAKRLWLAGKISNEELDAARDAARDALAAQAAQAARYATWTTWDAARAALAAQAARATWDATWDALAGAWAAQAASAARDAQNKQLEQMLLSLQPEGNYV